MNENLPMIDKTPSRLCWFPDLITDWEPINLAPLVQEVTDTFPNCKIDLFVKGNIAAIIFENYENIDSIIKLPKKSISTISSYKRLVIPQEKQYDLVINVDKNFIR
jgi:ADP-heptose:LPS heptosyltransferase